MQHLEVSCAVRRFFKSLGFKGLIRISCIQPAVRGTETSRFLRAYFIYK